MNEMIAALPSRMLAHLLCLIVSYCPCSALSGVAGDFGSQDLNDLVLSLLPPGVKGLLVDLGLRLTGIIVAGRATAGLLTGEQQDFTARAGKPAALLASMGLPGRVEISPYPNDVLGATVSSLVPSYAVNAISSFPAFELQYKLLCMQCGSRYVPMLAFMFVLMLASPSSTHISMGLRPCCKSPQLCACCTGLCPVCDLCTVPTAASTVT